MAEKRRFGDRKDARRVRDIDGLHAYMPFLMPRRCDAEVYINETVDVTELLRFLEERNGPGAPFKTTMFHCMLMAVSRVMHMRPLLNRFIANKKYYMRDRLTLGFTIKKQFADHAEETLMMLSPEETDTLADIAGRVVQEVHSARDAEQGHGPDNILDTLKKLPRPLMCVVMGGLNFLDRHGWLPWSAMNMDTNFASVMLSNLGSIRCGAVYHHLNNFGTNGIVVTIGVIHKAVQVGDDGQPVVRDVMELGVTLDERIADGFYFARSLKLIKHMFAHPELLDIPLGEAVDFEF